MEDISLVELVESVCNLSDDIAGLWLRKTVVQAQSSEILEVSAIRKLEDQVESVLGCLYIQ